MDYAKLWKWIEFAIRINEKKLRIEDALSATRAAIEEGIVDGGGRAYITVANKIKGFVNSLNEEERIGGNVVLKALEKPLYHIAEKLSSDG